MFEYIIGIYKGFKKDYIIIENNNIGYKIYTCGSTIASLPHVGEEVMLYIHQIVREDFNGLYGFLTEEELNMFNLLININGVGAKASLSLLSISNVVNLKYAILMGDEKHITKAPGIGKKTAQRIILEMKDKIKNDEVMGADTLSSPDINDFSSEYASKVSEALGALMSLGYTEKESQKAVDEVDKTNTIEVIIKDCLRVLMK